MGVTWAGRAVRTFLPIPYGVLRLRFARILSNLLMMTCDLAMTSEVHYHDQGQGAISLKIMIIKINNVDILNYEICCRSFLASSIR
ncbi:hypothetical protein NPIL_562091 [Nephila pilipes]|uniref:Uncharacterized protein n=1 Tax=Nephila pilipes TaxID=299642 RepID=A0A8X6TF76_NEPPI|nr:hypothetical protein NPIL_562091 [Nephila pilipes]